MSSSKVAILPHLLLDKSAASGAKSPRTSAREFACNARLSFFAWIFHPCSIEPSKNSIFVSSPPAKPPSRRRSPHEAGKNVSTCHDQSDNLIHGRAPLFEL